MYYIFTGLASRELRGQRFASICMLLAIYRDIHLQGFYAIKYTNKRNVLYFSIISIQLHFYIKQYFKYPDKLHIGAKIRHL